LKSEVEKGAFGPEVTVTYVPGNKPELFFYDEQGGEVRPHPNPTLFKL
jgi:hypothetical protein